MSLSDIMRAMRELYDREARQYVNATATYDLFPGLQDEIDRFHGKIDRSLPLLDLGCGIGRDTCYLTSLGYKVVACDLSMKMLEVTNERCRPRMPALVQLSVTRLPFKLNAIGGAWVCASLLHLPHTDQTQVVRELLRVLVPGGIAAFSMKSGEGEGWRVGRSVKSARWFTLVRPDEFEDLLISVGFTDVETTASGRGDWFISEARKP